MTIHNYITAESVTEGHPDKICDQISDAILDGFLEKDPQAHVACETFVTTGLVLLGGEISSKEGVNVDYNKIVRNTIKKIGYTEPILGFDYRSCAIINLLHEQSADIKQGVDNKGDDQVGAGDQGIMVGYATNETPEFIPLPAKLSHHLVKQLAKVRKEKIIPFLRPDGKSLVSLEYENNKAIRAQALVIAAQHDEDVDIEILKSEIREKVINPIIPERLIDENTQIHINRTGRFVTGGPKGDSGLTGRKIIVDSYGVWNHGGGAYSGKDPTKVDRSGAYMARYVAKNIVAADLADECEVRLSYVIGQPEPLSINIDCQGTEKIPLEKLYNKVLETFSFKPGDIIKLLDLRRPVYQKTAAYGHFGREDQEFTWEKTDKIDILKT